MNKKVLSAILFGALMAGTGTFTSCIDNDEPAGIENLRGAKAELIRAKITVEQANAALILAQAEVEKAKAAFVNAQASIAEAIAAKKEAEAEAEAARTEEEKARVQAQIAKYQQQIEADALAHQTTMVNLQNNLATAKRAYELLLAHVEIAKAVCADKDAMTLAELEFIVYTAQTKVDQLAVEVEDAQKRYYEVSVGYKYHNDNIVALIEKSVADAEKNLADAESDLAYWQNYKSEDAQAVEWMAEVETLKDSIAGLQDILAKKEIALELLKQSEEGQKLHEAVRAAEEAEAAIEAPVVAEDLTYAYKYFAGSQEVEGKIAKGTDAATAIEDLTGEGKTIDQIKAEKASYTEEYKEYLTNLAADEDLEDADALEAAYEDAVEAWEDAKANYADKKANTQDLSYATAVAAHKAYEDACIAAAGDPVKILKAKQAFADALVAWYNTLPAEQVSFNQLTLEITTQVVGATPRTELITKTVKEFLSDATMKDVYLEKLVTDCFAGHWTYYWSEAAQKTQDFTVNGETVTKPQAVAVFGKWIDDKNKVINKAAADMVKASIAAFGEAKYYINLNYATTVKVDGVDTPCLTVEPSVSDVKRIANYVLNAGAYGAWLGYTDKGVVFQAKNLAAILADLDAAIEYWTAAAEELTEAVEAYDAEIEAADAVIEAANKAVEEFEAQWEDEDAEVEDMEMRILRLTNMKDILAKAIATYLPEEYTAEMYDFEGFAEFLAGQVAIAEADVIAKKEALATAQVNAELALDGKYDFISAAKETLDKKLAELTAAQAKLDEATANLKKGLEIIAAVNAAE